MKGPGRKALLAGIPGHRPGASGDLGACATEMTRLFDAAARGVGPYQLGSACDGEVWGPVTEAADRMSRAWNERAVLARDEIESLSAKIRSVITGNPLPALVLGPDLAVSEANEAFSRISGIPASDLQGKRLPELRITNRNGPGAEDALKLRRPSVGTAAMAFPSGERLFEEYNIPVTAGDGTVTAIVAFFYDVTRWTDENSALKGRISALEKDASETAGLKDQIAALEEEIRRTRGIPAPAAAPANTPAPVPPPAEPAALAVQQPAPAPAQPAGAPASGSPAPARKSKDGGTAVSEPTYDVVAFELGGERYAMDIGYAREIVEMMPITPIPRAPPYLCGVMNLRGEITNIIDINSILGIGEEKAEKTRKIIVLSQEASDGENMGIVVDDVESVMQVRESQVERLGDGVVTQGKAQIKGVIKIRESTGEREDDVKGKVGLVIWIDIRGIIHDLTGSGKA